MPLVAPLSCVGGAFVRFRIRLVISMTHPYDDSSCNLTAFKDMDLEVLLLELRSSNFGYRSIRRPSFHYAFQIQPISFDSRVGSADFRL